MVTGSYIELALHTEKLIFVLGYIMPVVHKKFFFSVMKSEQSSKWHKAIKSIIWSFIIIIYFI